MAKTLARLARRTRVLTAIIRGDVADNVRLVGLTKDLILVVVLVFGKDRVAGYPSVTAGYMILSDKIFTYKAPYDFLFEVILLVPPGI